jgi:hypothetical protein
MLNSTITCLGTGIGGGGVERQHGYPRFMARHGDLSNGPLFEEKYPQLELTDAYSRAGPLL